ncbi:hypothetical protein BOX15_Mlig006550g1 [Macrostomum lignano]|uniref:PID domain-containing protein n=1 Tax=Macrostomum lignano TaxID=282301 RepID=A0A267H935_9PLAT|nr:hypothetical protein BOX15_Mlig006550g1 [Macrostomum lignano]
MSAEGDQSVSASHLSTVIEEEDLYDNHLLYSSGVNNSGGTTASQTPTDDESTSRRSSQISESSAAETATSGPSTVPKKSSLRRPIETGASSGARQLVEKRRNKAPSAPAAKAEKKSIFTLGHVRKIFGSQQQQQQQQQQQGSNSRRSSDGSGGGSEETELTQRRLSQIKVDSLPAVFLVKYLGLASAAGLFGVDSIKRPVDELVKAAGKRRAKTGRPLPIAQLTVLQQGVSVRPHPQSEGGRVDKAFHSIEGVSYAAADPTMRRIFCLVVLPEADQQQQQQQQKPECHAFVCNSVETAHRLVLAVTFAFESATSAASAATGSRRRDDEGEENYYQKMV